MYCSTTYPAKKKYSLVKKPRVSTRNATATTNETTQNLPAPIAGSPIHTAPRPHRGRGRGPARGAGRVRVYWATRERRMVSTTPLVLPRTQLFQKRITFQ